MTDDELVRRYLRQNPPRKDGQAGTYALRFLVCSEAHLKPRRVEIGLGTNVLGVAIGRAWVLLTGLYALGARFTGRLALLGKGEAVSVPHAMPDRRHRRGDDTPNPQA